MAMMKTMINKQAPAGLSEAVNGSSPTGSPTALENIQRQSAELQRQVRPPSCVQCPAPQSPWLWVTSIMTPRELYIRGSSAKKDNMMPGVCGCSQHAHAGTAEGH